MPPFSALVPTPDTTGAFDLMGFPAGEDSVRKIKALKPAAEIIAEMMAEARRSSERNWRRRQHATDAVEEVKRSETY